MLTDILERRNVKILDAPSGTQQNPYILSEEEEKNALRKHEENKERLRVPRRPPWKKSMTTPQLDRQEKDAFLDWRRGLAQCVVAQFVPCGQLSKLSWQTTGHRRPSPDPIRTKHRSLAAVMASA